MTQTDKAKSFAAQHVKGAPIILFNIWDAGSARTVAASGAAAVATGSHGVAEALGYEDGEDAPLEDMLWMLERIVAATDLPVSHDMERGYADAAAGIAENCAKAITAGAVGVNLEDSLAGGDLRPVTEQAEIYAAAKDAMEQACPGAWLNARTDVLRGHDAPGDAEIAKVIARAKAYTEAGADSLFVPFTRDLSILEKITAASPLPINAMRTLDGAPLSDYAAAGIARVSHGPFPWFAVLEKLSGLAQEAYSQG